MPIGAEHGLFNAMAATTGLAKSGLCFRQADVRYGMLLYLEYVNRFL